MKINKIKATSIAICCLVASLWSEAQCMDDRDACFQVLQKAKFIESGEKYVSGDPLFHEQNIMKLIEATNRELTKLEKQYNMLNKANSEYLNHELFADAAVTNNNSGLAHEIEVMKNIIKIIQGK